MGLDTLLDATAWAQELRQYGLRVHPSGWETDERMLVWRAVERMSQALGGARGLRLAIGDLILEKRATGGGGAYAFWFRPPWKRVVIGEALLHQEPRWLGEVAVVHELAHAWDAHTAGLLGRMLGRPGRLVRGMVQFVGDEPGPTWYGGLASGLRGWRAAYEEWAESVAAYLYPEYIAHLAAQPREREWVKAFGKDDHSRPGLGDRHRAYVEARFAEIRQKGTRMNADKRG